MARGKYLLVRKESRRESSNLLQWLNHNSSYNHITLWNYKITEWIDWAEFFLSPSQLLSVPRYWFYLYFMNSTLTNFNGARIIIKKEAGNLRDNRPLIVSEMRFELTRANAHYPLKVACLPIPPPAHTLYYIVSYSNYYAYSNSKCPRQESNLHKLAFTSTWN